MKSSRVFVGRRYVDCHAKREHVSLRKSVNHISLRSDV